MLGLLRKYPGYTYSSLMDEDPELIRLTAIMALGTKQEEEEVDDGGEPG